jgi:hypothetical protein
LTACSQVLRAVGFVLLAWSVITAGANAAVPLDLELPESLPDNVKELAAKGDVAGLTAWGKRYEHGESVEQDADMAITLYCVAARAGYADAELALGWLYANGRGVKRSDEIAAPWVWRAAARGDPLAARLLKHFPLAPDAPPARCILSNGEEYLAPLNSVPNPSRKKVVRWVRQLAPRAGIDPHLVLAMIEMESGFNAKARSPKNARGLMQLLPQTARRFSIKDEWNPLDNIRGGVAYMKWLLKRFEGDVKLALAGYNAGENAVTRHKGIPPYKETQGYVRGVLRICKAAHAGRWRFELTRGQRKNAAKRRVPVEPFSVKGLSTCISRKVG